MPDCQAVSGAAVAGTILPIFSLPTFHTVSKGQTLPWAAISHTPLSPCCPGCTWVLCFRLYLEASSGEWKEWQSWSWKVIAGLCLPDQIDLSKIFPIPQVQCLQLSCGVHFGLWLRLLVAWKPISWTSHIWKVTSEFRLKKQWPETTAWSQLLGNNRIFARGWSLVNFEI